MKRGFYGIGIFHSKKETNIGTLLRSALIYNASFVFTIGKRYQKQSSDTMKTFKHIPLYHYKDYDDFYEHMPYDCPLICIEQSEISRDIKNFEHPEKCIYLLGAEDCGIPMNIQQKAKAVIHLDTNYCLNVSVAGSIVMFDRKNKLPERNNV